MENETEVIRTQMEETRTSLTEKLEALEDHVASTVHGATAAVEETVQAVTDTVHKASEAVENTVEKVKESLDLTQHVQAHPWMMVGGAVAVGFLAGRLLPSASAATNGHSTPAGHPASSFTPPASNASPSPNGNAGADWLSSLTKTFGPTIKELEGLAIGALTSAVGEMVLSSTPEDFRPHLKEVIDHFTASLGGTVVNRSHPPS